MPEETSEQWRRAALAEQAVGRVPAGGPDDGGTAFDGPVAVVAAANAGDAAHAGAEADRLRYRHPDEPAVHHARAQLALADDRFADALAAVGPALERDPHDRVALAIAVQAGLRSADPAHRRAAAAAADALVEHHPAAAEPTAWHLTTAALAAVAVGDLAAARSRLDRVADEHPADGSANGSARRVQAELLVAAGRVAPAADLLRRFVGPRSAEARLRSRELVGPYERLQLQRFGALVGMPAMVASVRSDDTSLAAFVGFGILGWLLTLARAARTPWGRIRYYFTSDDDGEGGPFAQGVLMPAVIIGGAMAGIGLGGLWGTWVPAATAPVASTVTFAVLFGVDRLLVHRPFRRRRDVVADLARLL